VGALILTYFLCTLAFGNFEATLAYLTQDLLRLNDKDNFLVFAYVGLVLAVAQGGLYRGLARRGTRETTFMIAGSILMIAGMAALGAEARFASRHSSTDGVFGTMNPVMASQSLGAEKDPQAAEDQPGPGPGGLTLTAFLISAAIAVVGFSFMNPSINSLVSRRSDPSQQGEILGVNASANSLSRILGPMAGVSLYYLWPTHTLPYLFATALLLLVLGLSLHVWRRIL
jgi:MFS transporter, DHA1 family, tetracycline resistance protein